ncbi:MAG: flagellar hook-basal body complex protein FliE [Microthrixaceae bacterium]|nr:flagellar hook-basal body complex protein FliE [Microthrixaceae bacterium]MCO5312281.1 flagellar hook-basal body complex protein FliE [Microthrixaceae bacterium]
MAIISPVSAGLSSATVAPVATPTDSNLSTRSSGAEGFDTAISGALNSLNDQHLYADQLARDAATGNLQSIEDYMMAATEAQLSTQLTVAVRNKALEAFNEIMRMQV